ncbi:hypothetical protein POJ06DRAFT_240487 [Lipomyces tetrasporus]|uniref:Uncharacterized protein n=1 Tax=Lipomyces tetrasporus TaxID=54092 RepID=A0AAD7QMD5_9ASCO|nr:uncharacterized protein POJ06DRAFT_240487 [Lipomyces tetrasporus]KAJ8097977.1 hypothetical protein POJ06DRAFT_240487 [Lipomyces tetrasporus]
MLIRGPYYMNTTIPAITTAKIVVRAVMRDVGRSSDLGRSITCLLVVVDDWLGVNVVLSHPTYVEDVDDIDDVGELDDDDDVCADINQLDVVEDVVLQDVTVVNSIIITTSPLVTVLYDTTALVVVNGVPVADTESDEEIIDEGDTLSAIVEVLDSVLLVEELVDVVAGLLADMEGLVLLGIDIDVVEVLVDVLEAGVDVLEVLVVDVLEVLVDVLEVEVDVLEVLVVDVVSALLVDVEVVLLEVDVDVLRVEEVVTIVVEVIVEVVTLVEVTVVVDVVDGVVGVAAAVPPGDIASPQVANGPTKLSSYHIQISATSGPAQSKHLE